MHRGVQSPNRIHGLSYERGGYISGHNDRPRPYSQHNPHWQHSHQSGHQAWADRGPNHGHSLSAQVTHDSFAVSQLESECEAKDILNQRLQDEVDQLREEIMASRERERNPALLNDYQMLQDQLVTLRREHTDLERDARHSSELLKSERSISESNIKSLENRIEQEMKGAASAKEAADDRIAQMRQQFDRDIDSIRREGSDRLDSERKRVGELEVELSKLRSGNAEAESKLRAEIAEAEAKRRSAEATLSARDVDLGRKEELREMFEKESKGKQERLEESMKMVSTIQSQLVESQQLNKKLKSDLEINSQRLEELTKSLAGAETIVKDEKKNKDSYKEAYEAIGAAVAASAAQVRGMLVLNVVKETLESLATARFECTKISREKDEVENTVKEKELKITQANRERDDAKDSLSARENDLAQTREELLNVTIELRSLIDKEVSTAKDSAALNGTISGHLVTIESRDKKIKGMQEEQEKLLKREADAAAAWLQERGKLEFDYLNLRNEIEREHRAELEAIEDRLSAADDKVYNLERDAEDQSKFATLGGDLAKLLKVDASGSAAATANDIYRCVQAFVEKEVEEKRHPRRKELMDTNWGSHDSHYSVTSHIRDRSPGRTGRHSPTRRHVRSAYEHDLDGDYRHHHSHHHGSSGNHHSGGDEQRETEMASWLKDELRRSEERHARSKRESEKFLREVANALKFSQVEGTKLDGSLLIMRIKKLIAGGSTLTKKATTSYTTGSPKGVRTGHRGYGTAAGISQDSTKQDKLFERLQKKFRVALQTIESLEELVDWLKAKWRETKGIDDELTDENHVLHEEVSRLKKRLFDETHGSSHDHAHHDETHYRFFKDVVRVLGHRGKSSDAEVIREIHALVKRVNG